MSHYHAVVWIDHQKATVWQFSPSEQTSTKVHAHDQHLQVHTGKSAHGGHRAPADHHFFDDAALALGGAQEILVLGPAEAKHQFVGYLKEKHPLIGKAVVAVENSDHPTDGQLLDIARKHFAVSDRML